MAHWLGKRTQNQALMENVGSISPGIYSYELGSSTSKPQSTVISMWLYWCNFRKQLAVVTVENEVKTEFYSLSPAVQK